MNGAIVIDTGFVWWRRRWYWWLWWCSCSSKTVKTGSCNTAANPPSQRLLARTAKGISWYSPQEAKLKSLDHQQDDWAAITLHDITCVTTWGWTMVELFDAQLLTLRHSPKWSIPAVCAIARKLPPVLSLEAHLKLCKDNQELAPELIQQNIIFQHFYKGQGHRIAWWPQLFWATSSEYQGLWLLKLHLPRIQGKEWNKYDPQFPYVSLSLDLAKHGILPTDRHHQSTLTQDLRHCCIHILSIQVRRFHSADFKGRGVGTRYTRNLLAIYHLSLQNGARCCSFTLK